MNFSKTALTIFFIIQHIAVANNGTGVNGDGELKQTKIV
jgi:hypothetical protein